MACQIHITYSDDDRSWSVGYSLSEQQAQTLADQAAQLSAQNLQRPASDTSGAQPAS